MDDIERSTREITIRLPQDLYDRLASLAKHRNSSVGELVREACRAQYSLASLKDRLSLLDQLAALQLPVGTVEEMERDSAADPRIEF
jgi:Ribbon-helix-helix protein, copG family